MAWASSTSGLAWGSGGAIGTALGGVSVRTPHFDPRREVLCDAMKLVAARRHDPAFDACARVGLDAVAVRSAGELRHLVSGPEVAP